MMVTQWREIEIITASDRTIKLCLVYLAFSWRIPLKVEMPSRSAIERSNKTISGLPWCFSYSDMGFITEAALSDTSPEYELPGLKIERDGNRNHGTTALEFSMILLEFQDKRWLFTLQKPLLHPTETFSQLPN